MKPTGFQRYWAFGKAVVAVQTLRVCLRWLGFRRTVGLVGRYAPPPEAGATGADDDRHERRRRLPPGHLREHPMVWAVRAAGRRTLGDRPCLPTALALLVFLRRSGIPAELRIGVERPETAILAAHAWVESGGEVVLGGGASPDRYRPFSNVAVGRAGRAPSPSEEAR